MQPCRTTAASSSSESSTTGTGRRSEPLLQALLAKYPDALAGDDLVGDKPRRWLLISRETPVPSTEGEGGRWSLDHLFLDQDAGGPEGLPRSSAVRRPRLLGGGYAVSGAFFLTVAALRQRLPDWPAEPGSASYAVVALVLAVAPDCFGLAFQPPYAEGDPLAHQGADGRGRL